MTISTTSGSNAATGLLSSTATSVTLTNGVVTSMFESASVTLAGSGHSVMFLGNTDAGPASSVEMTISLDGTALFSTPAGNSINFVAVVPSGSHTLTYTATASATGQAINTATLLALDLGV